MNQTSQMELTPPLNESHPPLNDFHWLLPSSPVAPSTLSASFYKLPDAELRVPSCS